MGMGMHISVVVDYDTENCILAHEFNYLLMSCLKSDMPQKSIAKAESPPRKLAYP